MQLLISRLLKSVRSALRSFSTSLVPFKLCFKVRTMNYLTEKDFTCTANLPVHDKSIFCSFYAAHNGRWQASVTDKG